MENDWPGWFDETENSAKRWVNLQLLSLKLKMYEKVSVTMAQLVYLILAGMLFLLFMLFAFIAVGFYLSDVFHSPLKGFGVVSLLFLVLLIILTFVAGKAIKRSFGNSVLRELLEHDKDEHK